MRKLLIALKSRASSARSQLIFKIYRTTFYVLGHSIDHVDDFDRNLCTIDIGICNVDFHIFFFIQIKVTTDRVWNMNGLWERARLSIPHSRFTYGGSYGTSEKVKSSRRNENTANERKRDRFINTTICSLSPFRRSSMRWAHSAQSISQLSQNLSNDSTLFFMWLFFFLLVNCFIHCNSFFCCFVFWILFWVRFSLVFGFFFFKARRGLKNYENRNNQLLSLSVARNWSHPKICICMHKCSKHVRIFLGIFSMSWQCSQWNFCAQLNSKLSVADSKRVETRTIFHLSQANYSTQVHCVFSILPVRKYLSCTN